MLMTDYALNKDEKETWCEKVRTIRGKSGMSGKSGYSRKISGLSGLSEHQ
jgi:hypothetical protein